MGRSLVIVFVFSLLSLPFIGQLPTLADRNLGIEPTSIQYGFLYTCFGAGAMTGALSIGTVLLRPEHGQDRARRPRRVRRVPRRVLAAAAAGARLPGDRRSSGSPTSPIITSLSTVLQERLDDSNRGRVMALWIMGFGGTVPIGNLIAGPLIEATSVTTVVLTGAAIAVGLAAFAGLDRPVAPR